MSHSTPYDLFKWRKPNIAYLRLFGFKCFIYNNGKDNIGKFDAQNDEGIFLGYSLNIKAYRVLNKRISMLEESIHILFSESDNGILSEGFNELNLNMHFDVLSDEEVHANDQNEGEKKNIQELIQSLEEVE